MNASPPLLKAEPPRANGAANLRTNGYSDSRETTERLVGLQALCVTGDRIALPIPPADAWRDVDFNRWQMEANRLLREFRRTQAPRHARSLANHVAGVGMRVAMAATSYGDTGNGGGSGDATSLGDSDYRPGSGDATSLGDSDYRPCGGCHYPVTNANLGGHDGRSAMRGTLWCDHCADERGTH